MKGRTQEANLVWGKRKTSLKKRHLICHLRLKGRETDEKENAS